MYTSNTLHHLKELGLDSKRAHKTALKLRAHSVHYAHKLFCCLRSFSFSLLFLFLPVYFQIVPEGA